MQHTRTSSLAIAAALLGFAASGTIEKAAADQPVGVIRTFGFWVDSPNSPLPDFESDDSLAVIVLPDARDQQSSVTFAGEGSNNPDWLQGSLWVTQPAQHITNGSNGDEGAYFWLVDVDTPVLPTAGAHTVTGRDGAILDVQVLRIKLCDCSPSTSYEVVDESGYGATDVFVVVTALFSK